MNTILQKRIEEAASHYLLYEHKSPLNEILHQCDLKTEMQYHKDIENAFIAGNTLALQNQWISVEEALPECDKCHLAMYEDGGIIVAKYENETWWWQDGFVVGINSQGDLMYSSSCKVPDGLITHWMPIPMKGGEE